MHTGVLPPRDITLTTPQSLKQSIRIADNQSRIPRDPTISIGKGEGQQKLGIFHITDSL